MKRYTLNSLLEELKRQTPRFEKGQYFEVLKSIYPEPNVGKEKHIILEDMKVTLPMACSSKSKREFKKDNSPFISFFKDNTRGDFLEIIETNGYEAKCINRSLNEDIFKKYYNSERLKYININFNDVTLGNIKRVYRGIKKYI